jgi:iron(II)-dependent oxidoreductase
MLCKNLSKEQMKKLNHLSNNNSDYKLLSSKFNTNPKYYIERINDYENFYTLFVDYIDEKSINLVTYTKNDSPHPLSFELGHIILFYEYHFLRNIKNHNINKEKYEYFDSLTNKPHMREYTPQLSLRQQVIYMNYVFNEIRQLLKDKHELHLIDCYILELCLLHNEMHKEVIFFICQQLEIPYLDTKIKEKYYPYFDISNKFININGGYIELGLHKEERLVVWDNERPKHIVYINDFKCSKYPVFYKDFITFIEDGGYKEKKYWSFNGWYWLKNKKINYPINVIKKNDKWYRKKFDKIIPLRMDLPVTHISYYEAQAYCNYMGCRLPTENEFVYLLTNGGKTKYPWGDDDDIKKYSNTEYINDDIIPVNQFENGKNKWGIHNLYGNNWYWTSTPFYPFDGFEIDPLYDTFSYPFFYDRMIVKGASWCTGKELIYSNYRNAQERDKCFHYTGFFIVK